MTDADDVARLLAEKTSARSETATFVRMDGRFAVVNIGTSTITIPTIGFYPPTPGMAVRVQWVNGSPSVTGPVKPIGPIGRITAAGTPRATVTVDGETHLLYYRAGYTPAVNDQVEINPATYIIQGKVTGLDAPAVPGESGGGGAVPFDLVVRASSSGRYQSSWWGNDPWASSSNQGAWFYDVRIRDAVASGTVQQTLIYLPLTQERGQAAIGVHDHGAIPGGSPGIHDQVGLGAGSGRSGWVVLPAGFGQYLAAGNRGIGVLAPGGDGYNIWRGTASDPLSGAIRLIGIR